MPLPQQDLVEVFWRVSGPVVSFPISRGRQVHGRWMSCWEPNSIPI